MFTYDYQENLTLEQINLLGADNWEIVGIQSNAEPPGFNVFVKKGFQDRILITNTETGANFWVDESYSYGEGMILTFLTIFIFCVIGKIVYNFLFKNA